MVRPAEDPGLIDGRSARFEIALCTTRHDRIGLPFQKRHGDALPAASSSRCVRRRRLLLCAVRGRAGARPGSRPGHDGPGRARGWSAATRVPILRLSRRLRHLRPRRARRLRHRRARHPRRRRSSSLHLPHRPPRPARPPRRSRVRRPGSGSGSGAEPKRSADAGRRSGRSERRSSARPARGTAFRAISSGRKRWPSLRTRRRSSRPRASTPSLPPAPPWSRSRRSRARLPRPRRSRC